MNKFTPNSPWTEALRDEACEMWKTNSAEAIAAEMQGRGHAITRNAVIGLVHRAGKTANDKTEVHPKTPNGGVRLPRASKPRATAVHVNVINRARDRASEPKPEPFVCQDVADIVPLNLSLMDLQDGDCRWPIDAPAGAASSFVYCGHPAIEGKPYCAGHCRVAFVGIPQQKRAPFIERKGTGGVFGRVA